ncbi:hypothetical protein RFI_08312, partial [Reticulomyxa filosa]
MFTCFWFFFFNVPMFKCLLYFNRSYHSLSSFHLNTPLSAFLESLLPLRQCTHLQAYLLHKNYYPNKSLRIPLLPMSLFLIYKKKRKTLKTVFVYNSLTKQTGFNTKKNENLIVGIYGSSELVISHNVNKAEKIIFLQHRQITIRTKFQIKQNKIQKCDRQDELPLMVIKLLIHSKITFLVCVKNTYSFGKEMAEEKSDSLFATDQTRCCFFFFERESKKKNESSKKINNNGKSEKKKIEEEAKEKPKSKLELEHIYGFNGGALSNKYYRYKQHLIAKDGN